VRALVSGIGAAAPLRGRQRRAPAARWLFLIDPDRYRAARKSRRGRGSASSGHASPTRDGRATDPVAARRKLVSQAQLDEAVSAFEVAEANTAAARRGCARPSSTSPTLRCARRSRDTPAAECARRGALALAGDDSSLPHPQSSQTDPIYVEFSAAGARGGAGSGRDSRPVVRRRSASGSPTARSTRSPPNSPSSTTRSRRDRHGSGPGGAAES